MEYKPNYHSGYPCEEEWDWYREQGNGKRELPFLKFWSFELFIVKIHSGITCMILYYLKK